MNLLEKLSVQYIHVHFTRITVSAEHKFTVQAIDIWMGSCTAFVFAALIEFTFVNYTWRTR